MRSKEYTIDRIAYCDLNELKTLLEKFDYKYNARSKNMYFTDTDFVWTYPYYYTWRRIKKRTTTTLSRIYSKWIEQKEKITKKDSSKIKEIINLLKSNDENSFKLGVYFLLFQYNIKHIYKFNSFDLYKLSTRPKIRISFLYALYNRDNIVERLITNLENYLNDSSRD